MSAIRRGIARLFGVFGRERSDLEFAEELEANLQIETDELIRRGLPRDEARRQAVARSGGVEATKEAWREQRGLPFIEQIAADIRFAIRALRRSPAFTWSVILSVAIGIGATTAVFAVVDHVLLRPLPYPDEHRVIYLWSSRPTRGTEFNVVSYPDYLDWVQRSRTIESGAAFNVWTPVLAGDGDPEILTGSSVTSDYFRVLGVMPMLGRTFRADEDVPGGPDVVVLGHSLWHRRFGADTAVLGRTITLGTRSYTVIGVMPPSLRDPEPAPNDPAEIWRALRLPSTVNRAGRYLRAIARLRSTASVGAARHDLAAINDALGREYPAADSALVMHVQPIREQVVGGVRRVLWMVLAGACCVFLLLCANVTSLVLARITGRTSELALRSALGAARSRIVRLVAVETVLLTAASAMAGLALASATIGAVRAFTPRDLLPRVDELAIDTRVVAFTVLIAGATALLMGIVPALHASRASIGTTLRQSAHMTSRRGFRKMLVTGEIALSIMLVSAAGLIGKSLLRLVSVPLGFDTRHVLAFDVQLTSRQYSSDSAVAGFFRRLTAALEAVPNVTAAGAISSLPLSNVNDLSLGVAVPGHGATAETRRDVFYRVQTPRYREALGIALLRGRDFVESDSTGGRPVALINRTGAERLFAGADPIGEHVNVEFGRPVSYEIIGVVDDTRFEGPIETVPAELIVPFAQAPWSNAAVVVRTTVDPAGAQAAVRNVVRSLDPTAAVSNVTSLNDMAKRASGRQRFFAMLFGCFAAIAFGLSAIGTYGLIAYAVAERRRDIGIRLALGADATRIVAAFAREAALLIGAGLLLGTAGALMAMDGLRAVLYDIHPTDPVTVGQAAFSLALVALAASLLPARRVAEIRAIEALRAQ